MATWLRAHGIFTAGSVTENIKAVSIPQGFTLKRIIYNWRVQAIASDSDAQAMLNVVNYGGVQTLPSAGSPTPPDPSHIPMPDYSWPTYRWLGWEARRMIPRTSVVLPNGSRGGTYVDDGLQGATNGYGEVYADVPAGDTLDVWLSWHFFNWPLYPTFAGASYWLSVLYG